MGLLILDLRPPCPPRRPLRRFLRLVLLSIFHTPLCHTPSFTHIFVTHHLSHTSLSHTIFVTHIFVTHLSHTSLSHTIFHAGVVLGDIDLCFAWQAWRLWLWAGSGGVLGRRGAAALSRGRRGTWRNQPTFCVAGVVLTYETGEGKVSKVPPELKKVERENQKTKEEKGTKMANKKGKVSR